MTTRTKKTQLATAQPPYRESENLMAHKFKIGQTVDLERNMLRSLAPGRYEIRHLVPASDRNPGDPCYRIKSIAEKHERAASESELTLSIGISA
jgi:hypothetical protein